MLWIALMLFPDTIEDIIKLSYSQKLNVLKILWTTETFKLIIGMWLWQHPSSYCWCVFTSLAESEGLKINFKKQSHQELEFWGGDSAPSSASLWGGPCCMARSIGLSPELLLPFCWVEPAAENILPSLQPSPNSPSGADAGPDFPADVHLFLLCFSCRSAVPYFSLLPGPSEVISDGCAGAFSGEHLESHPCSGGTWESKRVQLG